MPCAPLFVYNVTSCARIISVGRRSLATFYAAINKDVPDADADLAAFVVAHAMSSLFSYRLYESTQVFVPFALRLVACIFSFTRL